MKEWNELSKEGRILAWREFRESLDNTSKHYLEDIAKYFQHTPLSKSYIDYYTPSSWPVPWEILTDGEFCINSVSIMIYYTIVLTSNWQVELAIVEDENIYLLPIVDGKYILNYELGTVITLSQITDRLNIRNIYTHKEIKNIK